MSRLLTVYARCDRLPSGLRLGSFVSVLGACCLSWLWLVLAPAALAQEAAQPPALEPSAAPRAPDSAVGERPLEVDPVSTDAPDPSVELSQIDAQLWELRHEARRKHWLASALLVVTGYGTALVGLTAALVTFALADDVRHRDLGDRFQDRLDVNNDGSIDRDDEQSFRRMGRSFAAVSGIGMAIGIVGSVLLAKDLREPTGYAREVRSLKQRRRELLRQLEYSGDLSAGRLALSLRGRF